MALGLIASVITASAAASALAGACFTVWTADALNSTPLLLSDVPNREADKQGDSRNDDDVIHKLLLWGILLLQSVLSSQTLIGLLDQSGDDNTDCNCKIEHVISDKSLAAITKHMKQYEKATD